MSAIIFGREEFVGREAKLFKEGARLFFLRGGAFFFGQAEFGGRNANLNIAKDPNDAEQTERDHQLPIGHFGQTVAEQSGDIIGKVQCVAFGATTVAGGVNDSGV